jgi:hypothetical protein
MLVHFLLAVAELVLLQRGRGVHLEIAKEDFSVLQAQVAAAVMQTRGVVSARHGDDHAQRRGDEIGLAPVVHAVDLVQVLLEVVERGQRTLAILVAHGTGKLPRLLHPGVVLLVLEAALACPVVEQAG